MFYIKGAAKLTKEDIEKVFALYDRVCMFMFMLMII